MLDPEYCLAFWGSECFVRVRGHIWESGFLGPVLGSKVQGPGSSLEIRGSISDMPYSVSEWFLNKNLNFLKLYSLVVIRFLNTDKHTWFSTVMEPERVDFILSHQIFGRKVSGYQDFSGVFKYILHIFLKVVSNHFHFNLVQENNKIGFFINRYYQKYFLLKFKRHSNSFSNKPNVLKVYAIGKSKMFTADFFSIYYSCTIIRNIWLNME